MKSFIKTVVVFFSILGGYFLVNYFFNSYQISKMEIPFGNTAVLIVGDSYSQRGIDPNLFNSAQNISQGSEPLYISFWKLKYLSEKIEIDTLLLSFSYHSISAFNDQKLTNKKWSSEMFRRTYAIVDCLDESSVDYDKNDYYNVWFRNMLLYPKLNHLNMIGAYEPESGNDLAHIDVAIKRHFYDTDTLLGVSEISISYLDSIVDLCKRKDIEFILVSSPVTNEYYSLIPDVMKEYYDFEKQKLAENGVLILDFSQAKYDHDYFINGDHLNEKGATKFTLELIESLKGDFKN